MLMFRLCAKRSVKAKKMTIRVGKPTLTLGSYRLYARKQAVEIWQLGCFCAALS